MVNVHVLLVSAQLQNTAKCGPVKAYALETNVFTWILYTTSKNNNSQVSTLIILTYFSPHRKAFKPPRRVAKTPEKREKHRKTPEKMRSSSPELEVDYLIKLPHKHKIKTPEKKEKRITPDKKQKKVSPDKKVGALCAAAASRRMATTPDKKVTPEKNEKKSTPRKTSEHKYDTKETLLSGKKEKHKIKIRVEREKDSKKSRKPEVKKSKSETADALVKLLVPYFKKGLIASKEVFKITARELTHCLLNKSEQVTKRDYVKFVDKFFDTCGGILLTEQDAKSKISKYNYIE